LLYNNNNGGEIMSLLESGENYLESILVLSLRQKEIHAIDIVNYLGYSKPSVSIMLKKLKEAGYIIIDEASHIFLTDSGLKVANKIYNRHKLLKDFLISIGVSEAVAEDDACKIEHDLSDETIEAIKKILVKES
jgi:Mn-dependent DtxR family transcriptional regulator